MRTTTEPQLAHVASVIGEPTRAAMLQAMMGGEPLSAGELARRAGVTPPTASGHLARLADSGLVSCHRSGRYRYYELADADVAAALEALARIAPLTTSTAGEGAGTHALRFARTCYDHLAGRLGVLLTDTLIERELIAEECHEVTARGADWFGELGVDTTELRRSRRAFARPCLDWTERRDHLAGAVGAALASALIDRRWLVRLEGTRALRLTLRGRDGLYRVLGVEVGSGSGG